MNQKTINELELSELLKNRLESQGYEIIGMGSLPNNGDRLTRLRTLDSMLHDWENDFIHRDEATLEVVLRIRKRTEPKPAEPAAYSSSEMLTQTTESVYLANGELNFDFLVQNIKLLMQNRDFASARKILTSILKNRKSAAAFSLLAQCDLAENRTTEALKSLQEAVAFQPTFDSCVQTAQVLNHLERYAEAERYWQQAQRMKPQSEIANLGLAKVKTELGQIDEALFFYESVLATNSRNAAAHEGVGSIALKKKRFREAHDAFARALEIQPNLAKALTGIVTCAYSIKSFSVATHYFEYYVNSSPITPDLLYTLASLQFQLGRMTESRSTLERVLMLKPGHSLSLELMKQFGA